MRKINPGKELFVNYCQRFSQTTWSWFEQRCGGAVAKSPLSGKQGHSYSSEHAVRGKAGFIRGTVFLGEIGEAGLQPKQITPDMRLKKHFKTRVQLPPDHDETNLTKWLGSSHSSSAGDTYWRSNLFFRFKSLGNRLKNNLLLSSFLLLSSNLRMEHHSQPLT